MKLQAKQKRNKYKDTDAWLDAVYRNNKASIDEALKDVGKYGRLSKKKIFKDLVKERMETVPNPDKALKKVSNSTIFTPAYERYANNAISGIKGDKMVYKQFRELTKERGRYTKIDPSKMKWDKYEQVYIYDGKFKIDFKPSPKEIIISRI